MIADYLNQTATWSPQSTPNNYGEDTYSASSTIACRWEKTDRRVRTSEGVEIQAHSVCYCLENIQEGDLLTYGGKVYVVVQVGHEPRLDGTINHREVFTYEQG